MFLIGSHNNDTDVSVVLVTHWKSSQVAQTVIELGYQQICSHHSLRTSPGQAYTQHAMVNAPWSLRTQYPALTLFVESHSLATSTVVSQKGARH